MGNYPKSTESMPKSTQTYVKNISCNGRLLSFDTPRIMGILNVTDDSFFDGGLYTGKDAALKRAQQMLEQGAGIIDIGGQSTRPGAAIVSEAEELQRVLPAVEAISLRFPEAVISIDTFRAKVAKEAVQSGAAIVNDISAGDDDPDMLATVAALQVP